MAAVAVIVIGSALWWAARGAEPPTATGLRPQVVEPGQITGSAPTPQAATAIPSPTAVPSATPVPTPIPTPTPPPVSFYEAADRPDWQGVLLSPMPGCVFVDEPGLTAGALRLTCAIPSTRVDVAASAEGRIVHIVTAPAVVVGASPTETTQPAETTQPTDTTQPTGGWSWAEQQQLGPHVVIDHGPFGEYRNLQTVYAGLDSIDEALSVGDAVEAGDIVGSVLGPEPQMLFSVWADDVRQDGASVIVAAPSVERQREAAAALREVIASPTDPRCPLVLSASQLPGASRSYRNGIHRGIDFGCGVSERFAHAIADGQVVYVVDDYADPTVAQREALLANAGRAGFTPHWSLLMLYGNFVVIDHGVIDGAGRVVTIAAHLESVAPEITLGSRVAQGQTLGEIGNRGTNASASGIRGSGDSGLHLHWELFIDGWYLGVDLGSPTVAELIATAMCGAAQTPGCPG